MKHLVFTVYDVKAEAYLRPFFVPTRGIATRTFENEVLNPESLMYNNPEDYTLFEIASFDDDNATFVPLVPPAAVLTGLQVLAKSRVKALVDEVSSGKVEE